MIEPTLALQTAIRAKLLDTPAVTALVAADQIRSGSTRPDESPAIIMANGQTINLGNAAGSQRSARVFLDLHIWATEDGADTAHAIGFAVGEALWSAPTAVGFEIDDFARVSTRWMRDPDPATSYTHGVMTIEAVIRWSA